MLNYIPIFLLKVILKYKYIDVYTSYEDLLT